MIGSDRPFLKPPPVYGRFKLNPWEGRSLKPSRDSHTLMPNRPAETNHCLIVPALVIHAPHFQPISPHTQNVLQHLQYPAIELFAGLRSQLAFVSGSRIGKRGPTEQKTGQRGWRCNATRWSRLARAKRSSAELSGVQNNKWGHRYWELVGTSETQSIPTQVLFSTIS